jgi:carboxyl-terminal processing protease
MPARNLVWVLVVATIALLLWNGPDVIARRETVYELFSPMVDVRAEIHKRYVEEVDDKVLMRGAIDGMLHSLDPFSAYLSPDEYPRFKQHQAGKFGGIGIEIGMPNGVLTVISPMENTPAFKAGIVAGDRILEIDGEPTDHMTRDDAVQKLMGAPGSQVSLKVYHTLTDQAETVSITRAEIEVASIWGWQRDPDNQWSYWLDDENKIAYVRISGFLDNTPVAFNQVMQKLQDLGIRALVLDLRFNPGGSLPAAVAVADRFLDSGTIVSVRGRWRAEEMYKANGENTLPDFPVVVLVNEQTASGAEIVAGALRDHERGVIIGKRTYGKGSVQEVIELGTGNSAIKLTTAYYYLPNGELIHRTAAARQSGKWGVEPNITVDLSNEEMQQIVESRMVADRVNGQSTRPTTTAPAKPYVDRQLSKALEVLEAKLTGAETPAKVAASQPAAPRARTSS